MLDQEAQESFAAKTASPDKELVSGALHGRKGVQNKIQFRTIAPKLDPKVMSSGILSCPLTSLPDIHSQPVSGVNSKPLVVPAQNYALMQVAGQEGTFSLVALPQISPAMATQQIQQPNKSLSENIKLPIPRYQPTRLKKSDKKTTQSSNLDVPSKFFTLSQTSTQTHLLTTTLPLQSEVISNPDASEQVILIDPGSTEITVATLLTENSGKAAPSSLNKTEEAEARNSGSVTLKELSSEPVNTNNFMKNNLDKVDQNRDTSNDSAVQCEKSKESSFDSTNVNVLSPSMFGNAVQFIPSATPKGKLPILPYSKMKNTICSKPVQKSDIVDVSASWSKSESGKLTSFLKNSNVTTKVSDKLLALVLDQISAQTTCESVCHPATKFDKDYFKKISSAAKRRGRKRKPPDEVLAFHAKRKKYVVKLRENKNSIRVDSHEPKAVTSKKYRSIMPKPIVVQALAAPVVQTQTPQYMEQKLIWNYSPASRHFSSKQNVGTKVGSVCQSPSFLSKSWHKCHVCNHNFQFKHHLQAHMNTHTNRRPYNCRLCRKAYMHSGSLSTHMKLHHSESRPKKLMHCEFCTKVFGHIKVYFGHLKEVHRVLISTETSVVPQEQHDAIEGSEQEVVKVEEEGIIVERKENFCAEEEMFHNPTDNIKLLIRCGRCQITTPTFADMKLHLLYVHGQNIQGSVNEANLQNSRGSQEELVKHVTHCWKQLNERRHLFMCGSCEDEFYSISKLRKHLYLCHQNNSGMFPESKATQSGNQIPVTELQNGSLAIQKEEVQFKCKSGFSCVLCKQILSNRRELLLHWQKQHNCEDPSFLWTVFSLFFKQNN
ncbi:zinc finger protein 438 isoform X2 [Microcaecilia unicolor]|nr:zinc finger protein 438 isoform X2 [Microcaecilia unicolor]XP_030055093.1 zinc finger protein 438 isoform X2 [Microcaecilia unicolor]XP_030055099.1 zinc finger protein 438 isoform X2 [Microcaecilia unicolor]XP_030055102.1 zinc finger protein 438 isoform X2 [Microcaecilia unicolor]